MSGMPDLKNKTILLLSPQSWGKMFVSKHHYAIELAKRGNTVYFLNPPEPSTRKEKITIEDSGTQKGLFIIHHKLSFPYNIKFHFITLFHALMKMHIKNILREIGTPIDIVWSFDLGNLYPFQLFPGSAYRIFHPVDEPLNNTAIHSGKGAQIIFSVTKEILQKYSMYKVPAHFINHGVSESFLKHIDDPFKIDSIIRVGFSGNLLRSDIDRETFLTIINQNPNVIFECWGSYEMKESNIGGSSDISVQQFIQDLKSAPNVILHGAIAPSILAKELNRMDAFLICYDVEKDQSKGTNYHKVMEYLSTGKVIISNNITTYKEMPALISMVTERQHNNNLPMLFSEIINKLDIYNSTVAINQRKEFAAQNTYEKQLSYIEQIIKN
jgi:hypothetical protein